MATVGLRYARGSMERAGAVQTLLIILRGVTAFVLVGLGLALTLFSIAVAFGWDRDPFSVAGTMIAVAGLSSIFGAYRLLRDRDSAPVAVTCLKLALEFGSSFLIVGLLALFLPSDLPAPVGYFLATGSICIVGFLKFRTYTRDH